MSATTEMTPEIVREALDAPILRIELSNYLTLSDSVWNQGAKFWVKEEAHDRWRSPFKAALILPGTRSDLLRLMADPLDEVEAGT